jgi:hypothetical protein
LHHWVARRGPLIITGGIDRPDALHQSGTLSDGTPASAVHLISRPPDVKPQESYVGPAPHAFVVKQAARSVLKPHFHYHRQFQVVVRGSGELGRHHLSPGSVHYAAAETAYGPIVAGEHGLWYMTLRQVTELGAQYLPVQPNRLQRGIKRRQCTGEALPVSGTGQVQSIRPLIAGDQTGLAAWLLDIPPSEPLRQPEGEGIGDRYYVVLDGLMRFADEHLPELSVMWVDRDEPWPSMIAGDDGLRLIIAQFPNLD